MTPPGTILLVREGGVVLHPPPSPDPNDPLNWSLLRKCYNFALILATVLPIFGILQIQTILWQLLGPELHASPQQLNNSLSILFVGLALGCVFIIPLTRKFGRRSTYVISVFALAAASFWTARMKTVTELYLTNLIQGLAGATNETSVMMTIGDIFFVHQRGRANAWYLSTIIMGTYLIPIAGGVQATRQGWRAVYYGFGIAFSILWLLFVFTYEETKYIPTITGQASMDPVIRWTSNTTDDEEKKDAAITTTTEPLERVHTQIDPSIPMNTWRQRLRWTTKTPESLWKLFYMPLLVLVKYPHVMYGALQFAAGIAWLTITGTVLSIAFSKPPYNFNPASLGYMGIGALIGNVIGAIYAGWLGDIAIVWFAKRKGGWYEPEMRLYLLVFPVVVHAGGIILFGVSAHRGMHWIYPEIGLCLFGFGLGSISDAALTMVIDTYPALVGEAFVGISFVRNALSIAIPFTLTSWMKGMNLQNMFILVGFVSLATGSLFIVFVIFGKRIRIRTAHLYLKAQ
ncbi:major facilitator superfamily transporter [Periconia macrospinosa]|uniref:Major facilitator superfamily transporter n=1 Tax=Periconia macrospinosa TaxID=97972 RepID=A0A2V1DDB9_9PLEO|nr:major facilitator superfamily transporter [Periconia macrospinosa]